MKSGLKLTLSQAVAAELVGVTPRRLRQLGESDDPPPRDADGQYPAAALGVWLRRRALAKVTTDGFVYEDERARLTHHQANKTALEERQLEGVLIPAVDVEAAWSDMVLAARAKLLALPGKLATVAVASTTLREIEDAARTEVYAALMELSRDETTPA